MSDTPDLAAKLDALDIEHMTKKERALVKAAARDAAHARHLDNNATQAFAPELLTAYAALDASLAALAKEIG